MLTARSRLFLRLAASLTLILVLAFKVHWPVIFGVWGRINPPWFIGASLLAPAMIVFLSLRWQVFLRQQSIHLPGRSVLRLTWAGQFFNSVLPGSTGGDVVKIYQACKMAPDKKAGAAASVIVDRFTALIALVILAGISLCFGKALPDLSLKSLPGSPKLWIIGGGVAAVIAALLFAKVIRSPHWVSRIHQIVNTLRASFTPNPAFFLGLATAFGVHLTNVAIFYAFSRSLGISITYFQALSFFPIILFLLMIPVTINGHGLREMLLLFYFSHLHIALPAASGAGAMESVLSLSLLGVANDLLWALPGGLWYLLGSG
jgi:uncharacterized membrane protein YbhN (UPF0104 family)